MTQLGQENMRQAVAFGFGLTFDCMTKWHEVSRVIFTWVLKVHLTLDMRFLCVDKLTIYIKAGRQEGACS